MNNVVNVELRTQAATSISIKLDTPQVSLSVQIEGSAEGSPPTEPVRLGDPEDEEVERPTAEDRESAFEEGKRDGEAEGSRHGESDADDGETMDYARHLDSEVDNEGDYEQGFRAAFVQAYIEAYRERLFELSETEETDEADAPRIDLAEPSPGKPYTAEVAAEAGSETGGSHGEGDAKNGDPPRAVEDLPLQNHWPPAYRRAYEESYIRAYLASYETTAPSEVIGNNRVQLNLLRERLSSLQLPDPTTLLAPAAEAAISDLTSPHPVSPEPVVPPPAPQLYIRIGDRYTAVEIEPPEGATLYVRDEATGSFHQHM